ncbi:ankyrin repeat-containing domain protein [Aspergillus pseudoustus]|uniref:Ankyrin repeat-containing domain protein n=1 Tax=Aspergillus pseudoustus TaxID=1810923 RepID=A0ABR4JJU6_9EURO
MSRIPPPTLAAFPSEILFIIAQYLNVTALNSLLRSCQRFYCLFDSVLYDQGRRYINVPDSGTPLIWAVKHNQTKVLKRLLKGGADWPSDNKNGTTALHEAILRDNYEALEVLLAAGAELLVQDCDGNIALQVAARGGKDQAARLLISEHLKRQAWTEFEPPWQCALSDAIRTQRESIVALLLDERTTIASAPRDAIQATVHPLLHSIATWHGHCGILQLLCDHGADPTRSRGGPGSATLLHPTAQNGHVEAMRLALRYGADLTARDTLGQTALHIAAACGHPAAMDVLFEEGGVPVDIHASGSMTPLMSAAIGGQERAAELLLDRGADARARNDTGFNALDLAIPHYPPLRLIELLLNSGTEVCPLAKEVRMTALHWAARTGQAAVLDLLARAGAPVDRVDQRGRTALHLAVREVHARAVDVLLAAGADPNALDETDCSPLDHARLAGSEEIVERLIGAGAVVKKLDLKQMLGSM